MEQTINSEKVSFKQKFREWLRKKVVYLKRNTRVITMLLLIVTSCIFTFKMSVHSEAVIFASGGRSIALEFFIMTLSSFMSILGFVSFKRLNKKSLVPLVVTSVFLLIQFALSLKYIIDMSEIVKTMPANYVPVINQSIGYMKPYFVFVCITIASIPFMPLLELLLGKIDVSVDEEEPEYLADGEVLVDELADE